MPTCPPMVDRQAEAELVTAILAGDTGAARELVRSLHRPVYHFVHRMLGQAQDAEDVTQETFIKVFRSLAKVDRDRPIINWVLTIARRTALNHIRARKDWVEIPPEITAEDQTTPDTELAQNEHVADIWNQARHHLNEREYEVLWLRYGENLSTAETATATGLSLANIKTHIFRARQRLLTLKAAFR